jgi:hypothetical protein
VLILPPGHAESVRVRRPLAAREKRIIAGFVAALAALAIVLAVSLGSSGTSSANGCIYATIPAATGAQQISQCGSAARDTCASAGASGAFTPQAARVIDGQCRKAGLPVG